MKAIIIALALFGVQITAQAQSYKKAAVQVSGLTCAMCSNATLNALKTLPFVDKIDTDLNNATFTLSFKPGSTVNIDEIKNKVENAGFFVNKLIVTANFTKVKITNDAHVNFAGQTLHFMNVQPQVLDGDKDITVIDKNFIPEKSFRTYSAKTTMPCYKTGVMADCCKPANGTAATRVYHVTI